MDDSDMRRGCKRREITCGDGQRDFCHPSRERTVEEEIGGVPHSAGTLTPLAVASLEG